MRLAHVVRTRTRGGPASTADALRQAANVAAALAQAGVPLVLRSGPPPDVPPAPLVTPAPPTFAIWAPIFALSLGYAAHQARPRNRTTPLLRRAGWLTAAAFASTGAWAPLVRRGRWWSAQGAIAGIAGAATLAHREVARAERAGGLEPVERWLVALPVAMLAGWGTAASGVNLASMLLGRGTVARGRPEQRLAAATFLGLGALGGLGVRASGGGRAFSARAYGATLLWALGGAAANQRSRSTPLALLSLAGAVLAALRP